MRSSQLGNGPHAERGEDRPHVLVVDGNLALRMDLRAALHGAGFHVTACESRASARQALRVRGYALAVVEAHLPDGNGLDLVREIRATQSGVRTIMLAADADARQRANAVAAGAEDLFGKPLDMVPLLRRAAKLAGSPPKSPPPESSSSPVKKRRILLVDADPVFRKALADSLRSDGDEVLAAGSAEEAVALLSVDRVDGVLVDYRLTEVGGLELCRRIRKDSLQRAVPVLVVARPSDDVDAYRKAMGAGADDLVVRSKEPAMVKVRLRGLLSRMERDRERQGGLETRSALEVMSSSLPEPPWKPSSPPKAKARSITPPSVSARPSSSNGLHPPPPPPPPARPSSSNGLHPVPPARPSSSNGLPPPPPPARPSSSNGFHPVPPARPSSSNGLHPVPPARPSSSNGFRPPPPSFFSEPASSPASQPVPRGRREDSDPGRMVGWSFPRDAAEDCPSGIVAVGPPASRDGRAQAASRRGSSAGSK